MLVKTVLLVCAIGNAWLIFYYYKRENWALAYAHVFGLAISLGGLHL